MISRHTLVRLSLSLLGLGVLIVGYQNLDNSSPLAQNAGDRQERVVYPVTMSLSAGQTTDRPICENQSWVGIIRIHNYRPGSLLSGRLGLSQELQAFVLQNIPLPYVVGACARQTEADEIQICLEEPPYFDISLSDDRQGQLSFVGPMESGCAKKPARLELSL